MDDKTECIDQDFVGKMRDIGLDRGKACNAFILVCLHTIQYDGGVPPPPDAPHCMQKWRERAAYL